MNGDALWVRCQGEVEFERKEQKFPDIPYGRNVNEDFPNAHRQLDE